MAKKTAKFFSGHFCQKAELTFGQNIPKQKTQLQEMYQKNRKKSDNNGTLKELDFDIPLNPSNSARNT